MPELITRTVAVNQPPVAVISGPTTAPEGSTVQLDKDASHDPENQCCIWDWDLNGDGSYADAPFTNPLDVTRDDDAVVTVGLRVWNGGQPQLSDDNTHTVTFN